MFLFLAPSMSMAVKAAAARGCHHSQVEYIRDAEHLKSHPQGCTVVMCPAFLREHPEAAALVAVARERRCQIIQCDKFTPMQRRA